MNDYVLDASAALLVLSDKSNTGNMLRARLPHIRRHAPYLIDAEIGHVLRRHERLGLITTQEAETALHAAPSLVNERYPHAGPLTKLAWTWRNTLSFYDALYVALAVRLNVPLLTGDERLTKAPKLACEVELV